MHREKVIHSDRGTGVTEYVIQNVSSTKEKGMGGRLGIFGLK